MALAPLRLVIRWENDELKKVLCQALTKENWYANMRLSYQTLEQTMALALIFLAGIACLANRHPILGALCIIVSLMGVISAG
jgi:hypothetical protein